MVKIVFAHSASKIAFIRLHVACFVFLWLFFCVFLHVDGKLCFFCFRSLSSYFVYLSACVCWSVCVRCRFVRSSVYFVCLLVQFCARVRSKKMTKLLFYRLHIQHFAFFLFSYFLCNFAFQFAFSCVLRYVLFVLLSC